MGLREFIAMTSDTRPIAGKDNDIYFRVAKEPEQMLEKNRGLPPSFGKCFLRGCDKYIRKVKTGAAMTVE